LNLGCEAADLDFRAAAVDCDSRATTRAGGFVVVDEASGRWPVQDEVSRCGGCGGQGEERLREHVDGVEEELVGRDAEKVYAEQDQRNRGVEVIWL